MERTDAGRLAIWWVGLALVLAAMVVLWQALGVDQYVPTGVLIAGILLIAGVAVMASSSRFRATFRGDDATTTRYERRVVDEEGREGRIP